MIKIVSMQERGPSKANALHFSWENWKLDFLWTTSHILSIELIKNHIQIMCLITNKQAQTDWGQIWLILESPVRILL